MPLAVKIKKHCVLQIGFLYMTIRQAGPKDSFFVSKLILEPMKPLALFITGSDDPEVARKLLEDLFRRPDTQYSYRNTLVCQAEGRVVGSVTAYDGGRLPELRRPVDDYLAARKHPMIMSNETEAGEFYIDTISVDPLFRGKGIAGRLLEAVYSKAVDEGHRRVGLIVAPDNAGAIALYRKTGFEQAGVRNFAGKEYLHLVRDTGVL
ncbi:GNAT family N-acetyltransferase [Arcticibacter sp. MXS-1]|uniref:GNAT family N-acetyltransferase n=1 Tax=Arcticibacter sp. MXS-1 TaxID=3341726 RepID=UPI0035A901E5